MKKNSSKKRAPPKQKPLLKKLKCEDTFVDEADTNGRVSKLMAVMPKMSREQATAGTKKGERREKTASREQPTKAEKTGGEEKKKKNSSKKRGIGKKASSAENSKVVKSDKADPATAKVITAAKALCHYLLDMKESSVSTYFDTHLAKYAPSTDTSCSVWEKNMSKNRSRDARMFDSTRVKLAPPDPTPKDFSDYINASLVKFDNTDTEFIMTQYPLPDTLRDFWMMVSQKSIDRIITIYEPCLDEAIEEFSKIPSAPSTPSSQAYTPDGNNSAITAIPHTKSQLELMIEKSSRRCDLDEIKALHPLFADNYMHLKGWLINTRKVEPDERNKSWQTSYVVEVLPEGCSDATFVRVFNCCSWPWKKVPSDERKLLALLRAPWKGIIPKPGKPEPIVVMCDLGLDRSATAVLTTVIIELVLAGKPPDCDALFRKMRDQRAGCFTMSIFFTYALRASLYYVKIRLKAMNDVPDDVFKKLDDAMAKVPFIPTSKRRN